MTAKRSLYNPSDFQRTLPAVSRPGVGRETYRSDFRRDYARLIHSPAFRRLQGKTQLFPGWESDFFRNRLTHSLEVAQVAESLTHRVNYTSALFRKHNIDPRLAAFAGLAHDLGHPPFGHNGEKALDDCMRDSGGFEGNAQTFRILTKLEKKEPRSEPAIDSDGNDDRVGLNLCYRSLSATLKYDQKIPLGRGANEKLVKGYYACDAEVVKKVKKAVAPGHKGKFKTIECQLMDLADDIAYSTYDLEDSFKAGFLNPSQILSSSDELLDRVAQKVSERLEKKLSRTDVLGVLFELFGGILLKSQGSAVQISGNVRAMEFIIEAFQRSWNYATNGYLRTDLTSDLISLFIAGVTVEENKQHPSLSVAKFNDDTLVKVEVLKNYTYEATIMSPRLKVAEFRGYQIVHDIFEGLADENGFHLLPDDFRLVFKKFSDRSDKKRVICDFIAGMTDRYALEFYSRLRGENPQSIFKPL